MGSDAPISFLCPNPLVSVVFFAVFRYFSILFLGILRFFIVFWCYPVCSRCFLWVSDVFRSRLLPPIAQTARCGCQKPRDIANPFTNTPRFGLLTHMSETNFDTTFLDGISIGRYLASCIPQNPCHSKRFPKLRSIHHVMIFLSLVFDPWNYLARFASVSEPVYSRALFQSELVQNGSRRA